MTPPSNKNKSDQSDSASKSASKGSARKVKYVQSRYMQPTPTRSAEKKRDVKSTAQVKATAPQPPSATKRRLDYGQSLTARARTSLASRASITSQSAEFPSKTASRDSTASVTATPVNEAPARTSLQRIDNTAAINRTQLRASTSTVTKPVPSTTRVSGTLARSTTAPINRTVTRPSAPSTTRVTTTSDKKSEALSAVTASDRSDTALLATALLQWSFVNAKLHHALLARQLRAEQLIHTAHERLSELKTAVSRDRSDLELKQEIYLLEELLAAQMSALVEHVDSCASDSLTRYEELSTVLQYNTHRMPVSHVTLDDSVLHSLNECGADLEHVIGDSDSSAQLDKWSEVSAMLSSLSGVVHEEVTAVKQCEQLLGALSVVQELELSLHTHRLHLHEQC